MKIKAKDIQSLIEAELLSEPDIDNPWHGISKVNFHENLVVPPVFQRFLYSGEDGFLWLWVVFDEIPDDRIKGYLVVYDPRVEMYGLALKPRGKEQGYFIGYYGTFIETIKGM